MDENFVPMQERYAVTIPDAVLGALTVHPYKCKTPYARFQLMAVEVVILQSTKIAGVCGNDVATCGVIVKRRKKCRAVVVAFACHCTGSVMPAVAADSPSICQYAELTT
jgi:hypothetical protein